MSGQPPFFILSCARSGSTSLARILDAARNGRCASEPAPNLNLETRQAMEGRLTDLAGVVQRVIGPRIDDARQTHEVYGEKNVTYGPFIRELHKQFDAKFIFVVRDGRDVVRSLMDWHEQMFGTVYREARDAGDLSTRALISAANLPVHLDTSDYARPRPRKGSPLHTQWRHMNRFSMCAYYWSFINDLYLNELESLPRDAWTRLDYSSPDAASVVRAAEFVGLTGLEIADVESILQSRVNSLRDRIAENGRFPDWKWWDGGQRGDFADMAGATMRRLGWWRDDATRWKPCDYGLCWTDRSDREEWYRWMFDGRRRMHDDFMHWLRARDAGGTRIESVADFGCGIGEGYHELLADRRYVGVDLDQGNISWCVGNRHAPNHSYRSFDFISEPLSSPCDVVMSSGTIDNGYDIDDFLKSMVRSSRQWIYLTCYRGWFPELAEHRYSWSAEHGCFYSDISPARAHRALKALGCRDIVIEPVRTGRCDIRHETRIIARVGRQ